MLVLAVSGGCGNSTYRGGETLMLIVLALFSGFVRRLRISRVRALKRGGFQRNALEKINQVGSAIASWVVRSFRQKIEIRDGRVYAQLLKPFTHADICREEIIENQPVDFADDHDLGFVRIGRDARQSHGHTFISLRTGAQGAALCA